MHKHNLRYYRTKSGLSQKQVAEHLGMSVANYSKIERHDLDITLSNFVLLVDLFGCTIGELANKQDSAIKQLEKQTNLNKFFISFHYLDELAHTKYFIDKEINANRKSKLQARYDRLFNRALIALQTTKEVLESAIIAEIEVKGPFEDI